MRCIGEQDIIDSLDKINETPEIYGSIIVVPRTHFCTQEAPFLSSNIFSARHLFDPFYPILLNLEANINNCEQAFRYPLVSIEFHVRWH